MNDKEKIEEALQTISEIMEEWWQHSGEDSDTLLRNRWKKEKLDAIFHRHYRQIEKVKEILKHGTNSFNENFFTKN